MNILTTILDFIKKPLVAALIGFAIGIIIGLPILGWGLWPVEWKDADPSYLADAYKQEYLKMAVEAYMFNQDEAVAIQRWNQLGDSAPALLSELEANPATSEYAMEFRNAVKATETVTEPGVVATETATTEEKPAFNLTALGIGLGVSCILLLAVGGALVYFLLIKNQRGAGATSRSRPRTAPQTADTDETLQVDASTYTEEVEGQVLPVAQFVPTYKFGDDLFDESNSIDAPSGEFLGEYGVGILQTIGTGEPSKVAAFEVWLFDKNDAQTVTKVLMSEYAYHDTGILQSLESKGEPVLVEAGNQFMLETATLELVVRVLDTAYGQGSLPQNSFFDHLTLELTVYPKAVA